MARLEPARTQHAVDRGGGGEVVHGEFLECRVDGCRVESSGIGRGMDAEGERRQRAMPQAVAGTEVRQNSSVKTSSLLPPQTSAADSARPADAGDEALSARG